MTTGFGADWRTHHSAAILPALGRPQRLLVRGEGVRVWDESGKEYLDLLGGIAVNALGHAHPHLVGALTEQAAKLWHVSNLYEIPGQARLAERLVEATFADRVFFGNSGAEALECAIKTARRYHYVNGAPERIEILTFEGAFHGRTLATLAAGGQAKYLEGFGPKSEGFRQLPFGDLEAVKAAIGPQTAAMLIEPIQGEGGVLPAEKAYLEGARALCDAHNALLVFDEVQSGMGRSGELFAYMHYGVVPDILSSAKSLGGGFPIAAMLTTTELAKHFSPGTHGTTYGGNPLACAVGEAVLDIVNTRQTLDGVKAKSEQFKTRLLALGKQYGLFEQVRGMGLLLGCVLNDEWKGKAKQVLDAATAEGLMILQAGPDVLRFAPSLVVEDADIDEGLARFERALSKLTVA